MWAWVLEAVKGFGGWFVAALSFLAILRLQRKVGSLESSAHAADERAEDRERIAEIQIDHAQQEADVRVDAIKVVNDTQTDVSKLSDAEVANELRKRWTRDET